MSRRLTLPYWLRSSKLLSDDESSEDEDDDDGGECTSPAHLVHPKVETVQTALASYMVKHKLDLLPMADDEYNNDNDDTNDNGSGEEEEKSDYDV